MLLTGAMTILGHGSSAQLVVGILVVLINMLIELKLGPFTDNADDALSFLGSLQMLFTLVLGLFLKTDNPNDPTYDLQQMGNVLVLISVLPFLALAVSLALLHPKVRARVNTCCSRATAENDGGEEGSGLREAQMGGQKRRQHSVQIMPSDNSAMSDQHKQHQDEQDEHQQHLLDVDNIMKEAEMHERGHREKQARQRERSRRHTMARVKARSRLKNSKKMRQVAIFKDFSDEAINAVVDVMQVQTFQPGHVIVRQGDPADALFVIMSGTCVVKQKTLDSLVHGHIINRLNEFDHFGEAALSVAALQEYLTKDDGAVGDGSNDLKSSHQPSLRNANVEAGTAAVQIMSLSVKGLATVVRTGAINLVELKRAIASAQEVRDAASAAHHVWQRSQVYKRLHHAMGGMAASPSDRSLFS